MKRFFLLMSAAVIAMAACNKSEVRVAEPAVPGEMSLRAVSSPATKAGELTGTVLPNSYNIFAAATQRTANGIIENASFFTSPFEQSFGTADAPATATSLWKAGEKGGADFVAQPKYWPLGSVRMDFLAYAVPADAHQAPNAAANGKWTVKWDNPTVDVASSFTVNQVDTYANQVDFLYASANDQSVAKNAGKTLSNEQQSVQLNFKHAQALLIFNVRVNNEGDNKVQINDIEFITDEYRAKLQKYQTEKAAWDGKKADAGYDALGDTEKADWDAANPEPAAPVVDDADVVLKTVGTFNVDNSRNNLVTEWFDLSAKADNYRMPVSAAQLSESNSVVKSQATNSDATVAYAANIPYIDGNYAQLGESLLVPIQDKTNFVIKYTFNDNTYYFPFNELRGKWEAGKKYIYNLDMNLNEIVITETVADFAAVNPVVPIS